MAKRTEHASLEVALTAPIQVTTPHGSTGVKSLGGRQPRSVLAYLVLGRGQPVPHEALAQVLWPDDRPSTWAPALRGVVSRVRRFLGTCGVGEDDLVGADGCYWLHLPDGTRVDVEVALQAALVAEQHVEHDPTLAKTQAITALDLTSRPFLPGVHGPWVQSTRDRLARSRARALRALASLHLRTGDPDRAVRAARDAVEIEPLQEVNARLLMRAHNASGERAQALRVYERYRTHLAAELGVDPSRRTRNLHLQLLKG